MEKDKDYYYRALEEFARKNGYTLQAYGKDSSIGETFLVLSWKEKVISFVLTGYNTNSGSVYTCCYSDLNL